MLKPIDSKILFELDNNARQSYKRIADKLHSSKQVVGNHLESLVKNGQIIKFLAILDLSKVGLLLNKVYLRLTNTSYKDEEKIVQFLNKNSNVAWLARTEGIYDIAIALHTKDTEELDNFLIDLENKFGKFISEKIVNQILTGEFFHRDYLLQRKTSGFRENIIFKTQEKEIELDEIDIKILSALCLDARTSVLKIAEKTSLTADAIGKRIKKLEKSGVIKNYIIVLNAEKMKMVHYKILMKVANLNEKNEEKFLEFCRNNKNIVFYNRGLGSWEIELDLEVNNSEEFRNIMRLIKNEFSGLVKEYFSLTIYEIIKFNFLPQRK